MSGCAIANLENRFRGPSIQPVGAGRAGAQKPNVGGNSKKAGKLLRDLEETKLDRFALTVYLEGPRGDYQVAAADEVIVCAVTNGAYQLQLPPVAGFNGRLLTIKKVSLSANAVTIRAASNEQIEFATAKFMNGIDRACLQLRVFEPGRQWLIVAQFGTVA